MPYANEDSVKRIFQRCKGYTDDVAVQTIVNTQNSILNAVRAEPLDLTVAFADEIKGFSDEWAWIQNRIQNQNWDGLMCGDYIPISVTHSGSTYTFNMQIAGIDVYYNTCSNITSPVYDGSSDGPCSIVPHHIDFISKEITPWTVQWNTTNTNNGTASQQHPYLCSNVYDHLINTVLPELPTKLQNVIIEKSFLLEIRYSSSGSLTDGNNWHWNNLGKLWIPSSLEVRGNIACVQGTRYSSFGEQYPIFNNRDAAYVKCQAGTSSRATWWTLSPYSGNATNAVYVYISGYVTGSSASTAYGVPLCVRVA